MAFKKNSEELFSIYLNNIGLYWDYEKDWSGKKPDFTIYSDPKKSKIVAVVEIEDIDYPKEDLALMLKGISRVRVSNPHSTIRAKINIAREQLKNCKDYPCLLVINNNTGGIPSSIITLGAMLGDISISFPIWKDGKPPVGEPYNFFGKNGKMIDEKGKRIQNTTITAIGFIRIINPDKIRSGFDISLEKYVKEIKDIKDDNEIKKYEKKGKRLANKLSKKGYDLSKEDIMVNFVLNPLARLSFPFEYFERGFTKIKKYDLNTGKISYKYDWSGRYEDENGQ